MGLTLTLENEKRLPDGGPLTYRLAGKRGIDIGRDPHHDWSLPDPSRYISGKHCEIRYRDGGYWLTDVSTNGTYLNGSENRVQSPYRLHHGDRLTIGHYIVAVELDGEELAAGAERPPVSAAMPYANLWDSDEEAAPPIDPRDLRPAGRAAPVLADPLEWAVDVPSSGFVLQKAVPRPARAALREDEEDDWAAGLVRKAAALAPKAAVPNPSRPVPVYVDSKPGGPWEAAAEEVEPRDRAPSAAAPALREGATDVLRRFARGAGLPETAFDGSDAGEFAERLGRVLRANVDELKQLLEARVEAKRAVRSSKQTMVQAQDNNPVRFAPTAADALRLMFGPPNPSYLEAGRAFEESFGDLKSHQVKTFAAMQQALQMLIEDLDPQTIERVTPHDRGIGAALGSRKARLWETYQTRWQAKTQRRDGGMLDVFIQYFAECYDRA